jgi:hypothetical protein
LCRIAQLSCHGLFSGCLPCIGSSCWEGFVSGYGYFLRLPWRRCGIPFFNGY